MSTTDTPDRPATVEQMLRQVWKYALAVGVVSAILGIMIMVWTDASVLALAIILGIQLIFAGIYRLVSAVGGATDMPWMIGFVGILLLLGGIIALRNPADTVEILALVVGLAWLLSGVVQLVATFFSAGYRHRGWMLFNSVISIIAGIVVLSQPDISIRVLAWVSGLFLVIGGVSLAFESLAIRPDRS